MRKRHSLILTFLSLCLGFGLPAEAQMAGLTSFSILQQPTSPRAAALGLDFLSVPYADLSESMYNPSFIDGRMAHRLNLDYVGLFDGVKRGTVSYGFNNAKLGNFIAGFQFNSYGVFEGYNIEDQPTRDYYATEYLLYLGWGLHIDSSFSIGADFKPLFSHYGPFFSFAFALDVAGSYVSPNRHFSATLIGRNIGAQLVSFESDTEELPFSLDLGLSYKLQNAPFRFFFEYTNIQHWHLSYEDPLNPSYNEDPFTHHIERQSGVATFADNLARHALLGIELSLKGTFFARVGYSYRQMREIQFAGRENLNFSGFSYGFGIHAKRFDFAFARNNYHLGQAPNYLSISFNL